MINAWEITKFDRTDTELEEFILFAVCVANKRADVTAVKLEQFLSYIPGKASPFAKIEMMELQNKLYPNIVKTKFGQYRRIYSAMRHLCFLAEDVKSLLDVDVLDATPGVGPKTARFVVLHSVPNVQYAVLDTHILKFLRERGYKTPASTPSGKSQYAKLEKAFIEEARQAGYKDLAAFDLLIWKRYALGQSPVI